MSRSGDHIFDLLIIGGGINGAGIARDAAGRGLSVLLAEQNDLASATSSASSKLIHGGLRYLEHYAFRLVREALAEREVLLASAPHIIRPLRFVLPHASGQRPAWMIRAGLFLYDRFARRSVLPGSRAVALATSPLGTALKREFRKGFAYSDCWVDDARLVALAARAAADLGAEICAHTRVVAARRWNGLWRASLDAGAGGRREIAARAAVNAAGPWAREALGAVLGLESLCRLRLVKGSHIVVPRLYAGNHAFILQNDDRRVIFVIPYEDRFTLIGTTDVPVEGKPGPVAISPEETDYLCRAASRYLSRPVASADVLWSYAGLRGLYDDGKTRPSEVTRDYVLELDAGAGEAPALSVFGGKLTTFRKLAEHALGHLAPFFPGMKQPWTADAALPGGDLLGGDFEAFAGALAMSFPWLPEAHGRGLARRHGTRVMRILKGARALPDLGQHFGAGLYAREVDLLIAEEWARESEDILFRRTKFGLHLGHAERDALAAYMARWAKGGAA
ncbi:MAG: glycerol-3-phosphate dehydrogenase [Pseudomonadota bacterium]